MASALGLFAQSDAEVEAQGDQVCNMMGLKSDEKADEATMEWMMPIGTAFSRLNRGSLMP